MILALFNKIRNLGVDNSLSIIDIKKIRLSNLTYLFTSLTNIIYAISHIALKTAIFAPFLDIVCFLLSLLSLYLNYKKKYFESRVFNVSTTLLQIVILCVLFGQYPGNEYFLIPLFYLVLYFFESKKAVFIFSFLIASAFIFLKYFYKKYDAIYPMPEVSNYYFPTLIMAFIIIFIFTQFVKFDESYFHIQLERQKKLVEVKNEKLEEQKREILDSLNYAERIQRALLASKKLLDDNLSNYFILFKPKDVVSGDFYWATTLRNDNFALVTADSTGHGVPGAIMSIVNIASLKEAVVQGIQSPDLILNETRRLIIENLKNDGSAEGGKDGMDASLLCFDFKNNILTCACANNPVWIIRKNENGMSELIEVKPDRMPIGKHDKDNTPFTLHKIALNKGDSIYTLTDGFPDQFGGDSGKKFKTKQLQEILMSSVNEPMEIQKQKLSSVFDNWKGDLEQVDDVCIIGIKI